MFQKELKQVFKNFVLTVKQIIKILFSKDFWKYVASMEWVLHFLNIKK